jgi:hypothetical protein
MKITKEQLKEIIKEEIAHAILIENSEVEALGRIESGFDAFARGDVGSAEEKLKGLRIQLYDKPNSIYDIVAIDEIGMTIENKETGETAYLKPDQQTLTLIDSVML